MPATIRTIEYFYTTVRDRPGEAYSVLAALAEQGVDLVAFNAIPMGDEATQLVLFPAEPATLQVAARQAGLMLTGPQHAFVIAGDDRLGAFADIHARLAQARINVAASYGLTDGRGAFGYVVYVRHEDFERAATVLGALAGTTATG